MSSMMIEHAAEVMAPPENSRAQWIRRRAKLFEAGEYPDKGVSIAVDDLRKLTESFAGPVPMLIEHAQSPLEIGYLTAVDACGAELFGTLELSPEANALVERSGARALSLGLTPDLASIVEVSLVRNPRVPSAQLFSGVRFLSEFRESAEAPPPKPPPQFRDGPPESESSPAVKPGGGAPDWQRRYDQLRREQAEAEAERKVRAFLAEGKLTPAQIPFAKAILLTEERIEFDGESTPLARLAIELIERQPPHGIFGERAPAPARDHSGHLMLPEEVDFYRRHFPDVSLDEIAKTRK